MYWFRRAVGGGGGVDRSRRATGVGAVVAEHPGGEMSRPSSGVSTGKENCPGATHTRAFGKRRAKGPQKTLCSYCVVARTTYATSPPTAARSSRHSPWGRWGRGSTDDRHVMGDHRQVHVGAHAEFRPMPCPCSNTHAVGDELAGRRAGGAASAGMESRHVDVPSLGLERIVVRRSGG